MKLGPSPKGHSADGQRTADPADTLKRIEPLLKAAGITRVADITDLDRIGVPVFSSIRPTAESGAISVYNGKGLTKEEAKVSAIMEGIERYSAEVRGGNLLRMEVEDLTDAENAVNPLDLIIPRGPAYHLMQHPIAWAKGTELNAMEEIWVPASAVYHPYFSKVDMMLFRTSTNGLASGNNLEEAVLHGMCEVIERDAWSLAEGRRKINSRIAPPSSGRLKDILDKFTSQGVEVHLKDLTSDIGIPTVAAAADDVVMQDPALLNLGIATHPDPEVAAIKALLEVAQSRLTQIHGAREDTTRGEQSRKLGYERMKRLNQMWLTEEGEGIELADLPRLATDDVFDDLQLVRAKLNTRGLSQAIVVDLTRKELGIPVVRVIVPGLEVFAIDEDRVGPRLTGVSP